MSLVKRKYKHESETPIFLIANKTFDCWVKQIHLLTEQQIERNGIPYNGADDIQQEYMDQDVLCGLTIWRMMELFDEGVTIGLNNQGEDAPVIYDLITRHIEDMIVMLNSRTRIRKPTAKEEDEDALTINELKTLQAFAKAIYPTAKKQSIFESELEELDAIFAKARTFSLGMDYVETVENAELEEKHDFDIESRIVSRRKQWQ